MAGVNGGPGKIGGFQPQHRGEQLDAPPTGNRFQTLAPGDDQIGGVLGRMRGGDVGVGEGDGRNAPLGRHGGSVKDKVKAFFGRVAARFEQIGDRFRAARETRAERKDARTALDTLMKSAPLLVGPLRTEALVMAVRTGDAGTVAKVLLNIAQSLGKQAPTGNNGQYSEDQLRTALNNLTGSDKFPLDARTLEFFGAQSGPIRTALGNDQVAGQLLDLLSGLDLKTEMDRSFDQQIAFMSQPMPVDEIGRSALKNLMNSLFRSTSAFSNASVGMNKAEGHFSDVGKALMQDMSDLTDQVRQRDKTAGTTKYTVNNMPPANYDQLRDASLRMLDSMTQSQGPTGVLTLIGKDGLERLQGYAQRIIDNATMPSEQKNEAIRKLVTDQVFLRGFAAALANIANSGTDDSFPRAVAQVVQKAISNGAAQFTDPNLMLIYNQIREAANGLADRMIDLIGLPRAVDPPPQVPPRIEGGEGVEQGEVGEDDDILTDTDELDNLSEELNEMRQLDEDDN